jgi:two-component system response regulator CpxR
MPQRILMVDDDREFCNLVGEYIVGEGDFDFAACHDGQSAVDQLRHNTFDMVLMDVGMPVLNGFEALKAIREFSTVPVIMLTARGDDLDRILGLEIGADDYLPKPCNLRELVARVRAILRRAGADAEQSGAGKLQLGDLMVERDARNVYVDGELVALTGAEYLVLEVLLQSAGQVVDKDSIARHALGRRIMPYDRSVDAHVGHLRKKLGLFSDGQPRIKTVRGRGYLYVNRQ